MKRLLLFSIALVTTGSLLAQSTQQYNLPPKAIFMPSLLSNDFSTSLFSKAQQNPDLFLHHSGNRSAINRSAAINFYKIGTSANANTLFHSQSTCLSADQDLNLIMFTHRACLYYVNNGGNSGWINTSYSTDGGMTWDTTVLPARFGNSSSQDTLARYPSGIIFNPAGNTIASQAYSVVSGPYTNTLTVTGSWNGYYFGSSRLDSTNINQQAYPIADTSSLPPVFNEYWPNTATTIAGKYVYVLGSNQLISTTTIPNDNFKGVVLNKGTFNSTTNSFVWTQQEIHVPLAIDPLDTATYTEATVNSDMAWSADDSVGYIVQFGVDSAQYASGGTTGYYPIVFKSVDSGKTWNKLPYFEFDTSANIAAVIPSGAPYQHLPVMQAYNGSKCIVDNNYNLHIFTDILADGSSNPDSLGSALILPSYLFDLSTANGTTWTNTLVDTIFSGAYSSQVWNISSGVSGVFVDARIQVAVTPDRTKAFATWLDSDPGDDGLNDFPDIYSKGFDYTDGYKTPTVNFTGNSAYAEGCYWLFASTTAFSSNGTYTIPATISVDPSGNDYSDDPMTHYFVSGISFTDSDFNATGTSGIATIAKSNIGVAIYPNPTNGDVNVSFTQYTGQATIIVTNILGSAVKQFNNINIAGNQVSLNLEDLDSGIYFVRVETTQGSETQKVVITNKN